jgi:hypothetical protein
LPWRPVEGEKLKLKEPAPAGVAWGVVPTRGETWGDAVLFWPDRDNANHGFCDSIRFELWREGIDDYEYFHMLNANIELLKQRNEGGKHDALIADSEEVLSKSADCVSMHAYYSRTIRSQDIRDGRVRLGAQIGKTCAALE